MTSRSHHIPQAVFPGVPSVERALEKLDSLGLPVLPIVYFGGGVDGGSEDVAGPGGGGERVAQFLQSIVEGEVVRFNNLATWASSSQTLTVHLREGAVGRPIIESGIPAGTEGFDYGKFLLPLRAQQPWAESLLESAVHEALVLYDRTGCAAHMWLLDCHGGLMVVVRTSLEGAPPKGVPPKGLSICAPVHLGKAPPEPCFADLLDIALSVEPHENAWHEGYLKMQANSHLGLVSELDFIHATHKLNDVLRPYLEVISVCCGEKPDAVARMFSRAGNRATILGGDPAVPGRGPSYVLRKIVEKRSLEQGVWAASGRSGRAP